MDKVFQPQAAYCQRILNDVQPGRFVVRRAVNMMSLGKLSNGLFLVVRRIIGRVGAG